MGEIRVSGVGKAYKQYPSRWARLREWTVPFIKPQHQLKWVLQNISFHVQPGEAVGIIGVNGAGKSTLLKMITGTTQPTTGDIQISGRVAALLELGMGFHPEFTGRQNVFMAGQLLGLHIDELHELMPEIEAFAEIGDYIDQPVRVYSSGMQMRLAFSVATARRPDVLIVDEALSVGDAYFQHKSADRIREFRKAGTTLLIVSHSRDAIQSICDRAILLDHGRMALQGSPEEVMDFYSAMLAEREQNTIRQERLANGKVRTVSGTGEAEVSDICLINEKGQRVELLEVGATATLEVSVSIKVDVPRLVLGFMIKDRLGQAIYGINTHRLHRSLENLAAGDSVKFRFTFPANIGKGNYSVATSLSRFDSHIDTNYEWRDFALIFHVINTRKPDFVGCTSLDAQLEIEQSSPSVVMG
ncbi:lipopolysaccharide transport system ATP-binding protein [Pseudomonas fluvialis]|uniref:Lipopolysaccharide transport system ATP-binding protein n=1 Tax=Pseudomonas fluvialis TaxID=1793966 RepID=A0A7X0BQ79_9PSED|nr:ABC transporter ATP-binding protein [Pseudomonas fluvialis]MBB6340558.1 lipopolysaccharide transport system ATP-binding protein [Pseudomonas fluvialis]